MTAERATGSRWHVTWVTETGSTNADLAEGARAGAPDGQVLVTDHQTAGRGRLGRSWQAPPRSSLLVSVLLRPSRAALTRIHGCTQAVGLASRAACAEVAGVAARLKWPNDLLVDGRKLSGVLAERIVDAGPANDDAVVVGMGLNVNWPADVPPELAATMTALNWEAGREIDRRQLLDAYLRALAHRLDQWEHDPAGLAADYRAALDTLGRTVHVELLDGTVAGTAVDVTDGGALVVEDTAGQKHHVSAGDVVHARGDARPE